MRWNALGPTDAAGRTGGTIAAMGKGIEIEAMKPVEIDHVLHAVSYTHLTLPTTCQV